MTFIHAEALYGLRKPANELAFLSSILSAFDFEDFNGRVPTAPRPKRGFGRMPLSYIEEAIIITIDDISENESLWELFEDRHTDESIRRYIDSFIHQHILSISTNLVTIGTWNVSCIMIHLADGTRRYSEIACQVREDGELRAFAAAKRN